MFNERFKTKNIEEVEKAMREELINLSVEKQDPFAISLHLEHRYSELIGYHNNVPEMTRRVLGTSSSTGSDTDIIKRRYDEMIDLEVPKSTGMSLDDMLSLPCYEYDMILKKIRERNKKRNKIIDDITEDSENNHK